METCIIGWNEVSLIKFKHVQFNYLNKKTEFFIQEESSFTACREYFWDMLVVYL